MIDLPSRRDLAALTDAVNGVVPAAAVGFVRRYDAHRIGVLHSTRHGMGEFVLDDADVPEVLRPSSARPQQVEASSANAGATLERFLTDNRIQRVASLAIPGVEPPRRLWVALEDETPLSGGQLEQLERTADMGASLLNAPVSPDDENDRRRRLEGTAALLPALLRVLDVREVFDRLSSTAQSVLPHDLLLLVLFNDDLSRYTIFARAGQGAEFGPEVPNNTPPAVLKAWAFDIVDDYTTHPLQVGTPTARLGARSSLRLPIRFEERVIGGLAFISFERARYSGADVAVGRRLADYVAVALSHYQLAEESRRAAAQQEREASLNLLDGLMSTITGVLDVREVLERIFEISQGALPHDAMSIAIPSADGKRVSLYARTGALRQVPPPLELPLDPSFLESGWDFIVKDDCRDDPRLATVPSVQAGMRSLIVIPVRLEEQLRAWVNFWSSTPAHFSTADVPVARRVAAHITLTLSHQRLAEQARRNEELRAKADKIDLLDEVLASVTSAGALPDVIDRFSNAVQKVLAHDALLVTALLPDQQHDKVYASKAPEGSSFPDVLEAPPTATVNRDWDVDLVDDLQADPAHSQSTIARMGYRSALRIAIRLDNEFVGALAFLSFAPGSYAAADVPIAKPIADRVALSFARERGAALLKRADEATQRAARLEARVRALTDELDSRTGYRRVIGESPQWRQVLTQATQVAATETTVLLLGESGTGKEVVARFLHRGSPRKQGPFVAINCAALPEQLLEAELFGYERGAYTGATQSKPGQLEQAAGGTLFLDEVGEMSPSAQAKFLRVLQEREFQRLGGTRVLRSDARVVAATNRDLPRAIANGQFREDLYYRLNVFAIRLPRLRDRREDILPLSEAFLAELGRGLGRPPGGISREARQLLFTYEWPGNVRELRNILERAAILCDGGLITPEHLALTAVSPPATVQPAVSAALEPATADPPGAPIARAATAVPVQAGDLQTMERVMIEQALQNARFNKSKAAKTLGLTRHQLYIRMRKYGFD
jgi:transcriptional regulator with GAF, ATPase, and Fis domain